MVWDLMVPYSNQRRHEQYTLKLHTSVRTNYGLFASAFGVHKETSSGTPPRSVPRHCRRTGSLAIYTSDVLQGREFEIDRSLTPALEAQERKSFALMPGDCAAEPGAAKPLVGGWSLLISHIDSAVLYF